MDKKFYEFWFKGFSSAVTTMDDKCVSEVFFSCGNACSESFTKQWYIDEYSNSKGLADFVKNMDSKFDTMNMHLTSPDNVEVEYTKCLCPLYEDKLIDNPKLCQCSLHSLIVNWEAILGAGKVKVTLNESILAGDSKCLFTVNIL